MKILIYGINYAPELTGVGKYTGEMGSWLASKGHSVRVVTAPPYYPAWRVSPSYRGWRYRREDLEAVQVFRCPLWVPSRPRGITRLFHLMSFAFSTLPILIYQIFWRPEVIWVAAPSIVCAPAALIMSRICRAKTWLHIQDYEVDAAFGLGVLKGSRLRALAVAVEQFVLRRFDVISSISSRMVDRAVAKGVCRQSAILFPNWVDIGRISPQQRGVGIRSALGIPVDAVVALYSGNIGVKQGLELLVEAARQCVDLHNLVFVFCGDGSGKTDLVRRCSSLSNVFFLELQPVELLGELLGMADIHLLPQRSDAADLVMPSKLTGMLASGRPVLATAAPGTEVAGVLESCGVVVPPGEADAVVVALRSLAADEDRRRSLGKAARDYAERFLSKGAVLGRFEAQLRAIS